MEQPQKPAVGGARRTKQRLPWILSGALLAASLGLVVVKLLEKPNTCVLPAPDEKGVARHRAFEEAKSDIREGRWAEAKERLLKLERMAPDYPGLRDYLDAVEKELPNDKHLKAAEAALKEQKLAVAKAELDLVSPSTFQFERLNKQKSALRAAADARVHEAQVLLDGNQSDQAFAIAQDVLAVFPEDREAQHIIQQPRHVIMERIPYPVEPERFWELAVERYEDGDLSGALALAKSCAPRQPRCKSGLPSLTAFADLKNDHKPLDLKKLSRLRELEKRIIGPDRPSRMARYAGPSAAGIYFEIAERAKAASQWARAVDYATRTLEMDKNHAGAAALINELRTKAKEVYLLAYALKEAQPKKALPKFREALALTAPDDETHLKAQVWIEKLVSAR